MGLVGMLLLERRDMARRLEVGESERGRKGNIQKGGEEKTCDRKERGERGE
jgi:hypothetical protein